MCMRNLSREREVGKMNDADHRRHNSQNNYMHGKISVNIDSNQNNHQDNWLSNMENGSTCGRFYMDMRLC